MKDPTDKATTELFPKKKGRGRPSTGTAKTAAERQAEYRRKKKWKGGTYNAGHKNLNIWVDATTKYALERLAKHYENSTGMVIEVLIKEAEEKLKSGWEISSKEWDNYFRDV